MPNPPMTTKDYIYAVRMAVDHRNDAKKYIAEAEDHEAAAAALRARTQP